jgi:hypothetical protein
MVQAQPPVVIAERGDLLVLHLLRISDRRSTARPPRDTDRLADGLLRNRRVHRSWRPRRVWQRVLRLRPACRRRQQNQDRHCARRHRPRAPSPPAQSCPPRPRSGYPWPRRGICRLHLASQTAGRASMSTSANLPPRMAFGSVQPRSAPVDRPLARRRHGAPGGGRRLTTRTARMLRRHPLDCGSGAAAPRSGHAPRRRDRAAAVCTSCSDTRAFLISLGCLLWEGVRRIVLDTYVIVTAFRSRNSASRAVLDWVADRLLVPLLPPSLFLQSRTCRSGPSS